MRILVTTGEAGFMGSFLVDTLLATGHGVRVLDSRDPQIDPHGPPTHLAAAADLRVGDVRDRAACADALDGVDAVVHAEAAVGVGQSLHRVEHYVASTSGGRRPSSGAWRNGRRRSGSSSC